MSIFTRAFWKAAGERAVKTFAQTTLAAVPLSSIVVAKADDLTGAATTLALGAATGGLAALLSVLTSIGSAGVGGQGPSLANETTVPADVQDVSVGGIDLDGVENEGGVDLSKLEL